MKEFLKTEANTYIHPWAVILSIVVSVHMFFAIIQQSLLQALFFELRNPILNLIIAYTLFGIQKFGLKSPQSTNQLRLQKILWAGWFFIIGLYGPLHSITLFDLLNRYISIPVPGIIPIVGLYVVLVQLFESTQPEVDEATKSTTIPKIIKPTPQ